MSSMPLMTSESTSIMLNLEVALHETEDLERRRQLRAFLMLCRSRLVPDELGLPRTTRRRVEGLRRGEVAELIGVSVDWYRSLESGRPVRVSTQLLSRLAGALRLTASQRLRLFRLSVPELYRLDVPA